MRHEGEPSVEEILSSIKKVIARDNRETLQAERRRREVAGVAPEPEDEPSDDDEVLELDEVGELIDGEESLTTASAAQSMRESLAALAMIAEPGAQPQIVRSGETSLEGLTRELLRPMLAQWLEQHLPAIVDRLVQAEIARIAGKKR